MLYRQKLPAGFEPAIQFEKEAPVLGTVKKSADAYRSVLEGTPVVKSNRKSDVAQEYAAIAAKI